MPGSSQSTNGPKRPRSSRPSRKQPKQTKSSSEKESKSNVKKSSEELTEAGILSLSKEIEHERPLPENVLDVPIQLSQDLKNTVTLSALFAEPVFIDDNHENYLIGNAESVRFYPSVTTILNVYPKDFCTHNEKIKVKAQAGRERGKIVHDALAKLTFTTRGVSYLGEVNPLYINYIQAGIDWAIETGAIVKYPETKIWSDEKGFAGTIDGLAYIAGVWYLIDWKTGWPKYEDYMQLAAYREALREKGIEVAGCILIYLREDGRYNPVVFHNTSYLWEEFLACKTIYTSKQRLWTSNNLEI